MIWYFKLSYFTQFKINTVFFPFKNFIPDLWFKIHNLFLWFKIQNNNELYDFREVRLRDLTASCFLLQLAVIRCKWLRCKCPYSLSIYSSFEFFASKSQLYSLFYIFILVCQKSRLVCNISCLVSWFLAFLIRASIICTRICIRLSTIIYAIKSYLQELPELNVWLKQW